MLERKKISDIKKMLSIWNFSKNTEDPSTISCNSRTKYHWLCPVADDHSWEARPNNIMQSIKIGSTGCPCCRGLKTVTSNCLETQYPEIAKMWHPDNTLKPIDVTPGSTIKVQWLQKTCGHSWTNSIDQQIRLTTGCPICFGPKPKEIPEHRSLAHRNPELVSELHPKNNISARGILFGSTKEIWWICTCGYEWKSSPNQRTGKGEYRGCPSCSGQVTTSLNNVAIRHPDVAAEWDYKLNKEELSPITLSRGSGYKAHWICSKCEYRWIATVLSRCHQNAGCPKCKISKGEKRISEYLDKNKTGYEVQAKYSHKMMKWYRFDFSSNIKGQTCLIEYNGEQHYVPISFRSKKRVTETDCLAKNIRRDLTKQIWCKRQKIPLLIIPYWDFNRIEALLDEYIQHGTLSTSPMPEKLIEQYTRIRQEVIETHFKDFDPTEIPSIDTFSILPDTKEAA